MSEVKTFPGYWRIHSANPKEYDYKEITVIYTIIYKRGESLKNLLTRVSSKLSLSSRDTTPTIHYHSEDGTPIIMKDNEDLDILLETHIFPESIGKFDIYVYDDCLCLQEKKMST